MFVCEVELVGERLFVWFVYTVCLAVVARWGWSCGVLPSEWWFVAGAREGGFVVVSWCAS